MNKIKIKRSILSFILMFTVCSLTACANAKEDSVNPDSHSSYSEPEQEMNPIVRVDMNNYELSYSGELKDVIILEPKAGGDDIDFYVSLSDRKALLYILHFNSDEGDFVTIVRDDAGTPIPVAFQMESIPEGLSDADRILYCTAQDAVNEIAASLVVQ